MTSQKGILSRSAIVDEKYTIQFFIKRGSHAETYRVKDQKGSTLFLKLFHLSKLHRTQFDGNGNIKEIEFLKKIEHPNIVHYKDSGEWFFENQRFAYLVLDFISGETLAEKLKREHTLDEYTIKQIASGMLNGLKYLHTLPQPIVHNDINHQNIMLDLGGKMSIPKIIDFGYARHFHSSTKVYYREGLNPYYLAPECFNNIFSPQSDLFSVGALMYHLLFGMPPWFVDFSDYQKEKVEMEEVILAERNRPLKIPSINTTSQTGQNDAALMPIIQKALAVDVEQRFSSADEMLKAVNGEIEIEQQKPTSTSKAKSVSVKKSKEESGFSQIAGMDELKEMLYHDVIRALEEKELYEEYGLTIPNGMLLYGPPGCGKSFFAEKLAEEVGYNYVEVKPSGLASIYVHGSQEKIGQLFDEARKNAPTILNFDEFDALVPKRDGQASSNQSGEVNEFLTQLNNCGKDGVFVIASTNQPKLIDPAVLRAGRIDKIFYVPPPDFKARKEMFKMLLEKRPMDFGLDYDQLANKTENYVSVDVQQLINEAARKALRNKSKISQEILLEVIEKTRPSVSFAEIHKYSKMRDELESQQRGEESRPTIGFKRN